MICATAMEALAPPLESFAKGEGFRGLARTDAEAELIRRKDKARRNLKNG